MTLSDWVAQHPDEVVAEDANRAAVAPLLAVLAREITDAEGVPSDDGRLEHSFAACLTAARAALAACGYRLRSSAHHYLAIESLQYTIGLTDSDVSRLQRLRRMRSRAMYDQVGVASREDAQAALATARTVAERLNTWLSQQHPDLLSP
jgi:hypothetical protein